MEWQWRYIIPVLPPSISISSQSNGVSTKTTKNPEDEIFTIQVLFTIILFTILFTIIFINAFLVLDKTWSICWKYYFLQVRGKKKYDEAIKYVKMLEQNERYSARNDEVRNTNRIIIGFYCTQIFL